MTDPLALTYVLIQAGLAGIVIFGVLLAVAAALATAAGSGQIQSPAFALCFAAFLGAIALVVGGFALEGVFTGEVYSVLRKRPRQVRLDESPGLYWSSIVCLGVLAGFAAATSIFIAWRTPIPAQKSLPDEV